MADSPPVRSPDWSPDGSSLAVSRDDTVSGEHDLYTADGDGGNVTRLFRDTTQSRLDPAYSPADDRLAYCEDGDNALVVRTEENGGLGDIGPSCGP